MKKRRLFSIILSLALTFGSMSVAIADEVQLPTPEEIDSMHLLTPILEAETEAESETALQALADLDADGKLLALAQIAEFAEEQNDSEILIAFLPYIGEDLMDSLDAITATAILESNAYSDLFKIYIIDLANTLDNFSSVSYNEALVDVAMDSSKSDELRVYAAHDIDASMVSNPVAVYEALYDDASSMDDKMLMLKDIGFVDPATARELSLDVLDNYESYESRIVTMANKAYVRSINGEPELIDDIIARNREMMATGDSDLIDSCVYALAELKEPEAVELIFELDSFDHISGLYKLVDYNFDGIVDYTAEAGPDSLAKIVEAVPVEEFVPVIESRIAQRSANALSADLGAELLNTIELANAEMPTRAASSSNWDGYAVYRDGVEVIGIEINWHAGIVVQSDSNSTSGIRSIAHHPGGNDTAYTTYSAFVGNNDFMGAYRTTSDVDIRDEIVATAKDMVHDAIGYNFFSLIKHNQTNQSGTIAVSNLTHVRCDGFVEFAYELNDEIIRGANITTYMGAEADNVRAINQFTPEHQARSMNEV